MSAVNAMSQVGTSDAEARRLQAVRRYDILDTPPDGSFDHVTALAAKLFSVPISLISLVDTDRIWFKSHHGLDIDQVERSPGLCVSAILDEGPYVVSDTLHDPRTLANPLVAGARGFRFYAAAPLRTQDGHNLGTLCVIDRKPRAVSPAEIFYLENLAAVVMDQMELRLSARNAVAEVNRSLARAEMLGREIDHRVMNSLQFVVTMLDMQAQTTDHAGAAKQLDVAAHRILNIARVHRHFYLDETIETTCARAYLQRLCADFGEVLGKTTIAVRGKPVALATTKVMPLGIIVNELVTNAAKNGASAIEVEVDGGEAFFAISVRDDGDGLPPAFALGMHQGLGMRMIELLVQQLKGTLDFGSTDTGRGTYFTLTAAKA